jgi:hypothetical protein
LQAEDVEWEDAKDLGNRQKYTLAFAGQAERFESGADYLEIYDVEHSDSRTDSSASVPSPVGS